MNQHEMYTVAVANQTARYFLHLPSTDSYWEFLIFTKPKTGEALACLRHYSYEGMPMRQEDDLGLGQARDCWNWLVNSHNANECTNPFRKINR